MATRFAPRAGQRLPSADGESGSGGFVVPVAMKRKPEAVESVGATVRSEGLSAVEASAGSERRALDYLWEVFVEEHPRDEFLA